MAIRYSKKLTIRMSPPVRGTYSVSISHNGRSLWSGEIGYGFKPSVGEEANSPHTYDRLAGLALIDASASANVEPLTERTAAAGWEYPISRRMGGPIVNGKRRMVRPNPAVECSASPKRDRYRRAKVMHQGEWVQNAGCWDAKGVPSYVGKGESGKRRVIAKKAVRQKASRTPKFVKGARARKAR